MTSKTNQGQSQSPDFVVFSDDWGEHPSSCQHIFRHIAKNHRVLWVNTIGMRNPTLSWADARKAIVKISKMLGKKRESATEAKAENITVCQPLMLPGSRSRAVRRFNARSVTGKVQALLDMLDMRDPVVVATVPNASEYSKLLDGRKIIYYCVDDFSLWPGLDADGVREMEARLIERANSIITVSDTLFHRLAKSGKSTRVLTHGVDLEMFSTPVASELSVLKGIPKPRVGFFGLIDGRMDWDLVVPLAKRMPEVSFVFAGPADTTAGKLPRIANLHFVGPVRYADLPDLIFGVEVLLLPYRIGELADTLSPLKLREYMATMLPVIATPIPQALSLSKHIYIARTLSEWEQSIQRLRGRRTSEVRPEIQDALKSESWSQKAKQFLSLCTEIELSEECTKKYNSQVAVGIEEAAID